MCGKKTNYKNSTPPPNPMKQLNIKFNGWESVQYYTGCFFRFTNPIFWNMHWGESGEELKKSTIKYGKRVIITLGVILILYLGAWIYFTSKF